MLALTLYKRENFSFEFRFREILVMRSHWNVADLGPHHDQFILGNGRDRRLQRCDNILKSTKI